MTWPVNDRSSTLQIDFHYLRRQVSKFLHGSYHHGTVDDEQYQEVLEVIDAGIIQYYFPPVLPPEYALGAAYAHEWSFMRPVWALTTEADQRRYPLPPDWERPIGEICFVNTDSNFYRPISFCPASRLRAVEFQDTFTSYPQCAATETEESTGVAPQTQLLVLHPTPDAKYELSIQYQAHARRPTADQPFLLGGQMHGHGILASVMAAAEFKKNSAHGPLYQDFLQKLTSNVVRDQERGGALLGYNGNESCEFGGRSTIRRGGGLFYNNVTYGNTNYAGE